ncbi:uncharacterized protein LOC116262438 isoform X2 [Nymphaea colorata]|uniref:uncharacterized protein LOC116262438 isoform X2 n=1 Tax=Nymphaea colorata TaxID=210225 RepID=UPI00129EE7E9|nr:uncharacterized protein LOC116262438 isoform X2 [Nymphaea colorata]
MALSVSCSSSSVLRQIRRDKKKIDQWRDVQALVERVGVPSIAGTPLESLRKGVWVKLICGASFEDAVDVRNLSLVYTLAGVDCIDCAADESIVGAVREGIEIARQIVPIRSPWVMISVNDDEDLHFRKAEDCPPDCSRPCETVCPANAISLRKGGVITERCYGCGRCLPVCPYDRIRANNYVRSAATITQLLRHNVDAVEIHTSARDVDLFKELWSNLGECVGRLNLVAVSLPDLGHSTVFSMNMMYSVMQPYLQCCNLWQLDGRPMSGDIGKGATKEAIAFAARLTAVEGRPHGFLQVAGGTNSHTIGKLKQVGLFRKMQTVGSLEEPRALISGIAYGGYARKIVGRVLHKMRGKHGTPLIENYPECLFEALQEALALVGPVKCYKFPISE